MNKIVFKRGNKTRKITTTGLLNETHSNSQQRSTMWSGQVRSGQVRSGQVRKACKERAQRTTETPTCVRFWMVLNAHTRTHARTHARTRAHTHTHYRTNTHCIPSPPHDPTTPSPPPPRPFLFQDIKTTDYLLNPFFPWLLEVRPGHKLPKVDISLCKRPCSLLKVLPPSRNRTEEN